MVYYQSIYSMSSKHSSKKSSRKKSSHKKACDLMAKNIAAFGMNPDPDPDSNEWAQFGSYTLLFSIFFFFMYRVTGHIVTGNHTEEEKKIRMTIPTAIGAAIAPALICAYIFLRRDK
jgi:hypothetical protein